MEEKIRMETFLEKSSERTLLSILQNNTKRIYEISDSVERILNLLVVEEANEAESIKEPDCMLDELENQDKFLRKITNVLSKIEAILN